MACGIVHRQRRRENGSLERMTTQLVTGNEDRTEEMKSATLNIMNGVHPATNGATPKKLVSLDVDGTLVNHDGHMSPRVREMAQAVVNEGHHVVISTGRSLGATLPIVELLDIERGHAVASNGGVTLRIDTSGPDGYEVINRETFHPGQVLVKLRKALPTAKFALETVTGEFLATERFQDMSFGVDARAVAFDQLLDVEAVRLVVFSTDTSAEDFGDAVQNIGLHGVTYSVGYSAWLDIAGERISKASALQNLHDRLTNAGHVISETVAVGDGRNDVEMLQWADRGVAMGQAPDEVKSVANEVTGGVDEDGLADVLESLLER